MSSPWTKNKHIYNKPAQRLRGEIDHDYMSTKHNRITQGLSHFSYIINMTHGSTYEYNNKPVFTLRFRD